ncbi:MAG TPA: hypothetical protein VF202_14015 [Trueperaceae bacterium]|jgi:hypothetical protein
MDGTQTLVAAPVARDLGVVLLTVAFIAYGGTFVLRVVRGAFPATPLQKAFFRAGHAHAGMLVTLGLVVKLAIDLAGVTGIAATLSNGVLWAAVLMPAGFFLSVASRGAERPSRLIALLWLGAAALVVGVVAAGIGLIAR